MNPQISGQGYKSSMDTTAEEGNGRQLQYLFLVKS